MKTEDVKLFTFVISPRKRAYHIVAGNKCLYITRKILKNVHTRH